MRREHKYRAFYQGTMYDVYAIDFAADTYDLYDADGQPAHIGVQRTFNLDGEPDLVLMQWTGLTDRNRRDIYENDILASYPDDPYPTVVQPQLDWNCGCCCGVFGWIFQDEEENTTSEVIGNTLQHPELLKEADANS